MTVATWGGSTVPTDDTTSSISVPVDLDETNDSLDESSPLMDMLNAVGKILHTLLMYTVHIYVC